MTYFPLSRRPMVRINHLRFPGPTCADPLQCTTSLPASFLCLDISPRLPIFPRNPPDCRSGFFDFLSAIDRGGTRTDGFALSFSPHLIRRQTKSLFPLDEERSIPLQILFFSLQQLLDCNPIFYDQDSPLLRRLMPPIRLPGKVSPTVGIQLVYAVRGTSPPQASRIENRRNNIFPSPWSYAS